MSQDALAPAEIEPLNARQLAFARELGVAIAKGGRDDELMAAYEAAGYAPNRGNARRLAADPRVKRIADEACKEALRLAGLHIGYLQAKALEILHLSPMVIVRAINKCLNEEGQLRNDLTEAERAELDAATWPLSKVKVGDLSIEIADKKSLLEMLGKQLGHGKDDPANVNVDVTLEQMIAASYQVREEQPVKEPA
jgi:hypothetical protein